MLEKLNGTAAAGSVNVTESAAQPKKVEQPQNVSYVKETTSEDDLVELDDSTDSPEQQKLDSLQQKRDGELDKYFEYQQKIIDLQKKKKKYEEKIEKYKDDPDKASIYQNKLSNLNAKISSYEQKCAECETSLNELSEEIETQFNEMMNASTVAANGANTAMAGQMASSSVSSDVTNAVANSTYVGETIPSGVASALDARLGSGFSAKCEKTAAYLGCNVNDLLAMMYSESGLQTTARNKSSNAIGLIQFMPSTLQANGYSTEQVASMSGVQQLDVIADIFMKAKKMAGYGANQKIDGGTLYAINWLPAYAKSDTLATQSGKYYSSGLDMNHDGAVTKADLSQRLSKKYSEMTRNI